MTMNDVCFRGAHNRGVTPTMLAGVSAPPVRPAPRGSYVCDPKLSKRAPPRPVRPNSEKCGERPVEPVPAREARAARVLAHMLDTLDGPPTVPQWRGPCTRHAPRW